MATKTVIVTNVTEYSGPAVTSALEKEGFNVCCHSSVFADEASRTNYESGHPGQRALIAQAPEDIVAETLTRFGRLDAVISNDFFPVKRMEIDKADPADLRDTLEALVVAPFRLASAAAQPMKAQRGGRILFITSGAPMAPAVGTAMYTAARAAANMLPRSLAKELGPFGIQVNAVGPYMLYNTSYFPLGPDIDSLQTVPELKALIPMERFGRPEEIGALISFMVSGRADFVSGQVIAFSGGAL